MFCRFYGQASLLKKYTTFEDFPLFERDRKKDRKDSKKKSALRLTFDSGISVNVR